MLTNLRPLDEVIPLSDECLSSLVMGMRLAGENQLHGTFWIAKQSNQSFRIVQQKIRSLISRKAARKSYRQDMFIEDFSEIRRAAVCPCVCLAYRLRTHSTSFLRSMKRNCHICSSLS